MPRLWMETIASHRQEVRDAIMDTTAALVAERGLLGVTMSEIAERTGIGRATLYKYFPDVEVILRTWHEGKIAEHVHYLVQVRDRAGTPGEKLHAVLDAFATLTHHKGGHEKDSDKLHAALETFEGSSHQRRGHHDGELAAFLHQDGSRVEAEEEVHNLLRELLSDAAQSGEVRTDVPPGELASYCFHALNAAGSLSSTAAVQRLVAVTLAGLRPPG